MENKYHIYRLIVLGFLGFIIGDVIGTILFKDPIIGKGTGTILFAILSLGYIIYMGEKNKRKKSL